MNIKKISIKQNALLNGIRNILNLLFPLIIFPYVSRILSVNEIGKYNFSQSIISYFLLIAALGIDKFAIREGTKYRDNRKEISEFASKVFSLNLVSTLISYVLLLLLLSFSNKLNSYKTCILIFSLQIFFTTIGAEWIYSIFENYTYITIRSIVFKVLSLFLILIFVKSEGDYLNYTFITVFATVGSNVLNYINIRKYCDLRINFSFNFKEMLIPILVIFASNVAILIYVASDITMLGFLKNDYVVGIYSISTKIYGIIKQVVTAILMVTIPRFSFYVGKKLIKEYDMLLSKVINIILIITLPLIIGIVFLRKNIILIIAGDKYIESEVSLLILSFSLIFSIMTILFNQCVLLPYKREKIMLKNSIISATINIGLNLILIPYFAEVGAAITTLLAEMTMFILNYFGCKDLVEKTIFGRNTKSEIGSIFLGCIGIAFTCQVIITTISNVYIQLFFSVTISIFIYFSILLILKNKILISYSNTLLNKIMKH